MVLESGIEAAVNRMTANGMTRVGALQMLADALAEAVASLSEVCLGDIGRLRHQMVIAAVKLKAEKTAVATARGIELSGGAHE